MSGHEPIRKVSVALASYNGARYLREQLDSILAQSRSVDEIVAVDDGSADETVAILRQYEAREPRLTVYENVRNLGYRRNFVRAAHLTTGDTIFFSDQDDIWRADKVEQVCALLASTGALLAYHGAVVADAEGRERRALGGLAPPGRTFSFERSPHLYFSSLGFTQAFRRGLLEFDDLIEMSLDHNETGEPLAHDQWYFFLASVLGTVGYTPLRLARYRQHAHNHEGWRLRRPALMRLQRGSDADGARANALACRARVRILEELSFRCPDRHVQVRLHAAGKRFADAARLHEARVRMYEEPSLLARANILARCVAGIGYLRPLGTPLGMKLLAQDLAWGLRQA